MITKDQLKTEYLKEALRLAELRLEEQNITLSKLENKAVLIATLCIVLIGYLLAFTGGLEETYSIKSWNIPSKHANLLIFKILPCLPLAVAMLYSIQSLNLVNLGTRGASPGYSLNDYFGRNLNRLAKGLLEDYDDRIKKNIEMLEAKYEEMKKARNWLYWGVPLAIMLVAIREMIQVG